MTPGLRPAPFRGELSSKRVAAPQTGQCRPTDRSHAWARRDEARESQASWTTSTSSSRSSSPSRLARMRTDKWPSKCVVVNQGECGGANTTGAGGAGMRYLQTSDDEGGGLRVIPARRAAPRLDTPFFVMSHIYGSQRPGSLGRLRRRGARRHCRGDGYVCRRGVAGVQ